MRLRSHITSVARKPRERTAGAQLALFSFAPFYLVGDPGMPQHSTAYTTQLLFNVFLNENQIYLLNPASLWLLFVSPEKCQLGVTICQFRGVPWGCWYLSSERVFHSPCLCLCFLLCPGSHLSVLSGKFALPLTSEFRKPTSDRPAILMLHRQNNPLALLHLSLFKDLFRLRVDSAQAPLTRPFSPNSQHL